MTMKHNHTWSLHTCTMPHHTTPHHITPHHMHTPVAHTQARCLPWGTSCSCAVHHTCLFPTLSKGVLPALHLREQPHQPPPQPPAPTPAPAQSEAAPKPPNSIQVLAQHNSGPCLWPLLCLPPHHVTHHYCQPPANKVCSQPTTLTSKLIAGQVEPLECLQSPQRLRYGACMQQQPNTATVTSLHTL